MLQSDLLFLLGGLAAGILLASFASIFCHRAKGRTASGLLNAARAEAARLQVDARHEAERLVTDSAREIETVRAGAEVEGKMASLKLREEVEKEAVKRREELDRLEKRALDREQSLDRRNQDIKEQEGRIASRDGDLKKKVQELEQFRCQQKAVVHVRPESVSQFIQDFFGNIVLKIVGQVAIEKRYHSLAVGHLDQTLPVRILVKQSPKTFKCLHVWMCARAAKQHLVLQLFTGQCVLRRHPADKTSPSSWQSLRAVQLVVHLSGRLLLQPTSLGRF